MTLEHLAGQRLMVGCDSTFFDQELEYLIRDLRIGGLVLFSRNIQSPEQTRQMCDQAQAYAAGHGLFPLIIAVDQEGGQVERFKEPFTRFKGNPFIQTQEQADDFARIVSGELKQAGINMNLAPVLDVAFEPDSVMKNRSFGADPQQVANLGCRVIKGLQAHGIMAVAKHFPGIGRTSLDSHIEMPVLDIDRQVLAKTDMLPFTMAARTGVAGIMLSHILYPGLDKTWPASLSPGIADGLLRNTMGYDGVIMTDDLDMGAVRFDMQSVIRQVLLSGIDMILICHKGPAIQAAFDEIMEQLSTVPAFLESAKKSAARIRSLKKRYLGSDIQKP